MIGRHRQHGFTLVELLVVITIIGILVAMLIPGVIAALEAGRRSHCQNNLRQYGVALQQYHSANKAFPVGNVKDRWWGFQSRLLPYLEATAMYQTINYNYPGNCFQMVNTLPPGIDPGNKVLKVDKCPDDPNAGRIWFDYPGYGYHGCTNYLGVMGTSSSANDGILFYGGNVTLGDVSDGASHTIIMGERGISELLFGWPYCGYGDGTGNGDNLCTTQLGLSEGQADGNHNFHFWSYHPRLAMFAFADGSGRPLFYDIDFKVFQALSTRAGGEVFELP